MAALAAGKARRRAKLAAVPYQPTDVERDTLAALDQRTAKRRSAVKIKVVSNDAGNPVAAFDHPDTDTATGLLMESVGTADPKFLMGLLSQIANAASGGAGLDGDATNFALSVVQGIEPRNEVEAMLAAQMAAVHMATMTTARQLAKSDQPQIRGAHGKLLNGLARTFACQVEALARYRGERGD